MAVEARHLNLFPSQLIGNREMMNPIEANTNMYNNNQMGYTYTVPLSGTTTETMLPAAYNSLMNDSIPQKAAIKSESGLTYNIPIPISRKRSRDSMINPSLSFLSHQTTPQPQKNCGSFSFLGEDISFQIQQHQFDIDRLISQHMEKVRMEIEEKRKRQARRIVEAIEVGMMKRLKAKEEEIEKIGKLNWALEERVKSLCIENQIWRDLAQTNEATANALRSNLEQVLAAQVKEERTHGAALDEAALLMDDAQSCCGSSGEEEDHHRRDVVVEGGRRTLACGVAQDKEDDGNGNGNYNVNYKTSSECGNSRWCRNCGKQESCVLLLPCRHLCLCTVCGSTLHICPICKSTKNASVHVNMS
ncbi:hypothetical protein SO802_010461 [Lithocarpus litseifolius]|uniref:RING-type E3 ubiquitin transferase n=1 Tax=Lithocarpus litseifolius TaxID=425828 RepID=A0AAW2DFQ3_9ROSI